jgi:hypothetical protein
MAGFTASTITAALTVNATSTGFITVASTAGFYVGATAWLSATGKTTQECIVTSIGTSGLIGLRFKTDKGYGNSDLTGYTVAASASITQPDQFVYGDDPIFQDEGVKISSDQVLNFVGAGVTATSDGTTTTVTVPGGLAEPLTLSQALTSSVASGSPAIKLKQGAQLVFNSDTGPSVILKAISTSGAQLAGFLSADFFSAGNNLFQGGSGLTTGMSLVSNGTNTASSIAYYFNHQGNVLAAAGSLFMKWNNNGTIIGNVDFAGKMGIPGTDGSGTAGAQTINKPSGKAKIASGASSVVITNSTVAAADRVTIQWEGDHGASRSWVTPAAGSFTVTLSSAASGDTVFSFEVKAII